MSADNNAWERRNHVVYTTKNSEYHCRGRECVAVRDRDSGRWFRRHKALRARLVGALTREHTLIRAGGHYIGTRLCFDDSLRTIVTSKVTTVGRPPKEATAAYSYQRWSGEIEVAA